MLKSMKTFFKDLFFGFSIDIECDRHLCCSKCKYVCKPTLHGVEVYFKDKPFDMIYFIEDLEIRGI